MKVAVSVAISKVNTNSHSRPNPKPKPVFHAHSCHEIKAGTQPKQRN
jgi:hypothetical protein